MKSERKEKGRITSEGAKGFEGIKETREAVWTRKKIKCAERLLAENPELKRIKTSALDIARRMDIGRSHSRERSGVCNG